MGRLPRSITKVAQRFSLGSGASGAATFTPGFMLTHSVTLATAVAAAAIAVAVCLPKIVESVCKYRAANLEAKRGARVGVIQAKSEAKALLMRTKTDDDLARKALEQDKADDAVKLLQQRAKSTDLPTGRRLSDETLTTLQAAHSEATPEAIPQAVPPDTVVIPATPHSLAEVEERELAARSGNGLEPAPVNDPEAFATPSRNLGAQPGEGKLGA